MRIEQPYPLGIAQDISIGESPCQFPPCVNFVFTDQIPIDINPKEPDIVFLEETRHIFHKSRPIALSLQVKEDICIVCVAGVNPLVESQELPHVAFIFAILRQSPTSPLIL